MAMKGLKNISWVLGLAGGMGLISVAAYAWKVAEGPFSNEAIALTVVSIALVLSWLALDKERVRTVLRSPSAQQSGTAFVITAVAAGIAIAATVLAHQHDRRWDLTSSQRFGLSEQTISILQGLESPVEIDAFFVGETAERIAFKDLMDGYAQHTSKLNLRVHDTVLSPRIAAEFDVTNSFGTVILTTESSKQRVEGNLDEEAMSNALVRLTADREHIICSTEGHGELDPDDDGAPGAISSVVTKLEGQNYTVRRLNPLRNGGIDSDCDVLLIPDPQVDFLGAELEMLATFLTQGGQVILLLDPTHAPGLSKDMLRYGIEVGDDIVLEQNPNFQMVGGDASYLILDATSFADHPVTRKIKGMILMRVARSVAEAVPIEGIAVTELIRTSAHAWAETDLSGTAMPTPDPETDRVGHVPLVSLAEIVDPSQVKMAVNHVSTGGDTAAPGAADTRPGGRILVFGDSDFTSNELLDQASNLDLLQNSIAWMSGEENQVSIRPNKAAQNTLTLNGMQGLMVWLICILLVPGIALAGAVSTWLSRRSR